MSSGHGIEARGLVREFKNVKAVRGIDLEVAPGEIYGFLGPNGAGKSTTLRILLGMLSIDGGSVRVLDRDPWRDAVLLTA